VAASPPNLHSTLASHDRVRGLTHGLYRYPARFSPAFVGEAIEELSEPNDFVLDPFLGGGTAAVEAVSRGRRFVGFDINPLSIVLARAKTTPLSSKDQVALRRWATSATAVSAAPLIDNDMRLRNAPAALVAALAPFVASARILPNERQRDAAMGVLLDAGQWAVDGRAEPAEPEDVISRIPATTESLMSGLRELSAEASRHRLRPSDVGRRRALFHGPSNELAVGRSTNRFCGRVALVVTSPPYPGVHVLYHRWQVRGRAETPLAYWLADSMDGLGPKHYTMGGRSEAGEKTYFAQIEATWRSLRRLLAPNAVVVQLVAFASIDRQLPRYLTSMARAGYEVHGDLEVTWRDVPNRRWYFRVRPERGTTREVLLVHRKAS
jgi:DNA modification methylase